MKTTIKSIDVNKSDYPYIGESKASGIIVLFTNIGTGIVLVSKSYPIGHFNNTWEEKTFERIDKITIQFES